jgi:hypothetical protein
MEEGNNTPVSAGKKTRRQFLKFSAAAFVGAIISACNGGKLPGEGSPPAQHLAPGGKPGERAATAPLPPTPIAVEEKIATSQAYTRETATAMAVANKTAEQILEENHAPPEVMARTVLLTLDNPELGEIRATGFIIGTMEIGGRNFALISSAGHAFAEKKNGPDFKITAAYVTQPQNKNRDMIKNHRSPLLAQDQTYNDKDPDFGLLLIEVPPEIRFEFLEPTATPPSENQSTIYGMGFPGTSPDFPLYETLAYITRPGDMQIDTEGRTAFLTSVTSPGVSGTTNINQNAELVAVDTGLVSDNAGPIGSRFTFIPKDYAVRKQRVIEKLKCLLPFPTPTPVPA